MLFQNKQVVPKKHTCKLIHFYKSEWIAVMVMIYLPTLTDKINDFVSIYK